MTAILKTGLSVTQPMTFCEDRRGILYMANGVDRPLRWDGELATAENAGLTAPGSALAASGSGAGSTLSGTYSCYVRYLDRDGIPSSLSPVRALVLSGTDSQIDYTSVPTSSDSRVTQRQIWRNTDGQTVTFYLDATIADNSTTTATSTKTDAQLLAGTSMRFYTEDGFPNANRFTPPPVYMSVVEECFDRTWWAVPLLYSTGTVAVAGADVTGTGTAWPTGDWVGYRFLYPGYEPGTILTVDSALGITLSSSIGSPTFGSAVSNVYTISPPEDELNAGYFSEADEPYAVPSVNKMETTSDGDVMTGLMPLASCCYFLKRHHIYRLACTVDPRTASQLSLVAERGCINQNSWCRVEGVSILLDRQGVYAFDGKNTTDISGPVADYFIGSRGGQTTPIDWTKSKWFHVVNDPVEHCVRVFLCGSADTRPGFSLNWSYRLNQWWVETYPKEVGTSCVARINGQSEVLVGCEDVGAQGDNEPNVCMMNTGYTDDFNGSDANAVAWSAKFGTFEYLPLEQGNVQQLRVGYKPAASGSMTVKTYHNRSATADTLGAASADNINVSGAAGASGYTIDITHAQGEARIPLDSQGYEGHTVANRVLDVELSGSSSVAHEVYWLDIEGVKP